MIKIQIVFESEALFYLARDCILEKRGEVMSRLIKYEDQKEWMDKVLEVYDECLDVFDNHTIIKEEQQ